MGRHLRFASINRGVLDDERFREVLGDAGRSMLLILLVMRDGCPMALAGSRDFVVSMSGFSEKFARKGIRELIESGIIRVGWPRQPIILFPNWEKHDPQLCAGRISHKTLLGWLRKLRALPRCAMRAEAISGAVDAVNRVFLRQKPGVRERQALELIKEFQEGAYKGPPRRTESRSKKGVVDAQNERFSNGSSFQMADLTKDMREAPCESANSHEKCNEIEGVSDGKWGLENHKPMALQANPRKGHTMPPPPPPNTGARFASRIASRSARRNGGVGEVGKIETPENFQTPTTTDSREVVNEGLLERYRGEREAGFIEFWNEERRGRGMRSEKLEPNLLPPLATLLDAAEEQAGDNAKPALGELVRDFLDDDGPNAMKRKTLAALLHQRVWPDRLDAACARVARRMRPNVERKTPL